MGPLDTVKAPTGAGGMNLEEDIFHLRAILVLLIG